MENSQHFYTVTLFATYNEQHAFEIHMQERVGGGKGIINQRMELEEPKPINLLTGKAITHPDYHLNEPASPYTNWEKTDNCFVSSVIIDKYF